MAIKHVEAEAAHLRRDHHPASPAESGAQIRREAVCTVAPRSWGHRVDAAAAAAAPGTPQAIRPAHIPRLHGGGGADPQIRSAVSCPGHPAPRAAGTPRPGGSRQLRLLHPAAPGRHLGAIGTDTPLPTHRCHRGLGGGSR